MSKKTTRQPFEELLLPRKELPKMEGRYRVYKGPGDYITVEATSALEAFKNSGLQNVHRIERDAIYLTNVLNVDALSNNPPPGAPVAAEAPVVADSEPVQPPEPEAQETKAADAPVAPEIPPAAETPLAAGDVDKLLQG